MRCKGAVERLSLAGDGPPARLMAHPADGPPGWQVRCVLPKLAVGLRHMAINPANQVASESCIAARRVACIALIRWRCGQKGGVL